MVRQDTSPLISVKCVHASHDLKFLTPKISKFNMYPTVKKLNLAMLF